MCSCKNKQCHFCKQPITIYNSGSQFQLRTGSNKWHWCCKSCSE